MIGYLLDQELVNALGTRPVATLLTQVIVDRDDPAFEKPTKFIGPVYSEREARQLAYARRWAVAQDGEHWRRVVPSPEPRSIVELSTIRLLVEAGVLVVCVGGGGIPVVVDQEGRLHGIEGVVDKDLAAALLAEGLGADALLMLTDVPAVELGWGTPKARRLGDVTAAELSGIDVRRGVDGAQGPGRVPVRGAHRRHRGDRLPHRGGGDPRGTQRHADPRAARGGRGAMSATAAPRRSEADPASPGAGGGPAPRGPRLPRGARRDPACRRRRRVRASGARDRRRQTTSPAAWCHSRSASGSCSRIPACAPASARSRARVRHARRRRRSRDGYRHSPSIASPVTTLTALCCGPRRRRADRAGRRRPLAHAAAGRAPGKAVRPPAVDRRAGRSRPFSCSCPSRSHRRHP